MKNVQGFPRKERHLSIVTLGYMQTIVFLLDVTFMKPGGMVCFHIEGRIWFNVQVTSQNNPSYMGFILRNI